MQISHESDKIAQVTFGTKSSRTARMADSAAFFHILSASLYSNPLLATVREIVCNADDAHRQAGVTEPIQIFVGESEESQGEMLIVRDFGHGIPDDKMDDIYLVFGESTKKDDSGATGGFGLGSKAPWAVVDQFFVTSNHNGTKTIYTLVKSDPDNDGRPSIQVMFRGPTTDTGLEVRVPIVAPIDSRDVVSHIKGVVFYGGIKAILQDAGCHSPFDGPVLLETLDLSEDPGSTTLVNTNHSSYSDKAHHIPGFATISRHAKILIRYGAVVYPIKDREYINLPIIDGHTWVIQAPADSLSLQPSRETLVFTETTKNTLKALEKNTFKLFNHIPGYSTDTLVLLREKLKETMELPKTDGNGEANPKEVFSGLDSGYVSVGYFSTTNLHEELNMHFMRHLSSTMLPASYALASRKLRDLVTHKASKILWKDFISDLLHKRGYSKKTATQLASRLITEVEVSNLTFRSMPVPKQLRKVLTQVRALLGNTKVSVKNSSDVLETLNINKVIDQIALLSKRVFITRLVADLPSFSPRKTGIVLHTSSFKKATEYKKTFEDAGWEVVNCWEAPERAKSSTATKSVKINSPKLGYLSLAAGLTGKKTDTGWFNSITALEAARQLNEDPKETRVTAPIAYVRASTAEGKCGSSSLSTDLFRTEQNKDLLHDFAKQIALTVNKPQSEAMEKKGIPELSTYINTTLKLMDVNAQINFYAQVTPRIFSGTDLRLVGSGLKAAELIAQVFPSPDAAKAGALGMCMRLPHNTSNDLPGYNPSYPLRHNLWATGIDTAAIRAQIRALVPKAKRFIDADAVITAVLDGDLTFQEALTSYFE